MNIIMIFMFLIILVYSPLKNLVFLAVGNNVDEAIMLQEKGLANLIGRIIKILILKKFKSDTIRQSKVS